MIRTPKSLTKNLSKSSRRFFTKILNNYELEAQHLVILSQACQCLDRIEEARLQIEKEGICVNDKFNNPKPHPALKIETTEKITFIRLIRELGLEVEAPGGIGRPPGPPRLY
jgi:phage terminase small subunit